MWCGINIIKVMILFKPKLFRISFPTKLALSREVNMNWDNLRKPKHLHLTAFSNFYGNTKNWIYSRTSVQIKKKPSHAVKKSLVTVLYLESRNWCICMYTYLYCIRNAYYLHTKMYKYMHHHSLFRGNLMSM